MIIHDTWKKQRINIRIYSCCTERFVIWYEAIFSKILVPFRSLNPHICSTPHFTELLDSRSPVDFVSFVFCSIKRQFDYAKLIYILTAPRFQIPKISELSLADPRPVGMYTSHILVGCHCLRNLGSTTGYVSKIINIYLQDLFSNLSGGLIKQTSNFPLFQSVQYIVAVFSFNECIKAFFTN